MAFHVQLFFPGKRAHFPTVIAGEVVYVYPVVQCRCSWHASRRRDHGLSHSRLSPLVAPSGQICHDIFRPVAGHRLPQTRLSVLKAERMKKGLSLADMKERTGMERSTLSRLENHEEANPTVNTLIRYAEAVGKKLFIVFVDADDVDT
jgi:hypothetical protein